MVPQVIGTYTSKIEHILDRVSSLRRDFKLKFMYDKPLNDNIDLVECMENNKIVFIKMREGDFPTKQIKNILVTYWISKVWLASQLRGMVSEKPGRCNVIVDELFQAPTSFELMEYVLPQSRKFGTKFVISTQYLGQLDKILEALEVSNSTFMFFKRNTRKRL